MVGVLVIIGSIEDNLGTRLSVDVTRRNGLSHIERAREREEKRVPGVLLLLAAVIGLIAAKAHVFQGSCDDSSVLCSQLCLKISDDTYECGCWNDHVLLADGVGCRVNTSFETIWHSAEEADDSKEYHGSIETAPVAFHGSNYAEFPVVESAYLETNISIEFKVSAQRDGILFFAGQFKGDDFISLALIGPNIMLRQDCGEGTIEDLYRGPFAVGVWHNVSVVRHYCYRTELRADGRQPMLDEANQFQNYKGITMDEGIFLGGAPRNVEFLDNKAGTDRGLTGCIRKVIVNGELLLDTEQKVNRAVNEKQLDRCGVERKVADTLEEEFFEFDIATGLEESVAALSKKAAPSSTTHAPSSTTVLLPSTISSTFSHSPLNSAAFSGSQFLSWPAPADAVDYLELVIHFKPSSQFGLLFLWRDGTRHAAVYLRKGFVVVETTMGADSALLRSLATVSAHNWHKLEMWRSGRGLLLKVDHQVWIEGELQSVAPSAVSDEGQILLGGFDSAPTDNLIGLSGFHGCIRHVRLNGRPLRLYAANGVGECSVDPCAAAGCPKMCAVEEETAVCLCEWPNFGEKCEKENPATLAAMNFGGHSMLEIKDEKLLSQIAGDELHFSIHFRLENSSFSESQLLAFAGDHGKEDADFFRLTVSSSLNAMVEMNLGSGLVELSHPTSLQPGRWHIVSVNREKRHVTMSIDGLSPISTMAPGSSEQLNVYSSLFIGGLPSRVLPGLQGCVSSITVGTSSVTQPSEAASAINIRDCSS